VQIYVMIKMEMN